MTIGEKIRYYREMCGFTQDEVAARLGTTPQNIYKYEKGVVTNIPLKSIEVMSEMFGISPGVLTGWEKSPTVRLTPSEKDLLSAFSMLDSVDRTNLMNYINNVLLVADKYQVKKESLNA